jgi:formylglycine-generating enzyme
MNRILAFGLFAVSAFVWPADFANADSFGSGANSFSIDFVTIGSPGNPADTTGSPNPAGSVPYAFRIGKYEVSEQMIDKANSLGGLGITKDTRGPDKPATSVSWFEAARFVNWLNTSTGSTPAYKFDGGGNFQLWTPSDPGYDANNLFRNGLSTYFLPSVNEWYKAAYYDPAAGMYWDYAIGSNAPPVAVAGGTVPGTEVYHQAFAVGPADVSQAGGLSPYGTMAQEGNVQEWEETELDVVNDDVSSLRGRRGGNWDTLSSTTLWAQSRFASQPAIEGAGTGFRIASIVPEPSAQMILLSICFIAACMRGWMAVGVAR